jgi:Tfp pilus assembly protein PilX
MKNQGIALVSVLSILITLVIVSVTTSAISINSVKTSENRRSHTVAKANADSGLEIAMVYLQAQYTASGYTKLPSAPLPNLTSDDANVQFSLEYIPENATPITKATIKSTGIGPKSSRYVSESFIAVTPGSTTTTGSPSGLVSEGTVTLTSGSLGETTRPFINAKVHGNKGFSMINDSKGAFYNCPEASVPAVFNSAGEMDLRTCAAQTAAAGNLPISLSSSERSPTCAIGNASAYAAGNGNPAPCANGTANSNYQTTPVSLTTPPYITKRNEKLPSLPAILAAGTNPTSLLTAGCTHVSNNALPSSYTTGSTICVTVPFGSTFDLPSGTYSGLNIVVLGPLKASEITLANSTLYSNGNMEFAGKLNLNSGHVFTNGNLSQTNDIVLTGSVGTGVSTIGVNGNLQPTSGTSYGNIEADENATNPVPKLNMLVTGNVFLQNMEKGPGKEINAYVQVGGSFYAKNLSLRGGVESKGNLTLDGNVRVTGTSATTTILSNANSTVIDVVSRR